MGKGTRCPPPQLVRRVRQMRFHPLCQKNASFEHVRERERQRHRERGGWAPYQGLPCQLASASCVGMGPGNAGRELHGGAATWHLCKCLPPRERPHYHLQLVQAQVPHQPKPVSLHVCCPLPGRDPRVPVAVVAVSPPPHRKPPQGGDAPLSPDIKGSAWK